VCPISGQNFDIELSAEMPHDPQAASVLDRQIGRRALAGGIAFSSVDDMEHAPVAFLAEGDLERTGSMTSDVCG